MPGPGQYFSNKPKAATHLDRSNVKPGFGSNETRSLKLINEEEISSVPGPGKYDVLPFNLDDLIRQCDDKKLVKEIMQNL
jgi:hypothetical protein